MGANTVQVCTGAMLLGYEMVQELNTGLAAFMDEHGFTSVQDVVGKSLPYFSTHHDLVDRQAEARRLKAEQRAGSNRDTEWGNKNIHFLEFCSPEWQESAKASVPTSTVEQASVIQRSSSTGSEQAPVIPGSSSDHDKRLH